MPSGQKDISTVLPLLAIAYQAEQLKMARINKRIGDLRDQLFALERPQTTSKSDINMATMAGVDLLWERWVEDRKVLINKELAHAFLDREKAKSKLVVALSKLEAAKKMTARAVKQARVLQERRANW